MSSEQYLIGQLEESQKRINYLEGFIKEQLDNFNKKTNMEEYFLKAMWFLVTSKSSPHLCIIDFEKFAANVNLMLGIELKWTEGDDCRGPFYANYLFEMKNFNQ